MTVISKVEGFSFDKAKRRIIKYLGFGRSDGRTGFELSPYGIDSGVPSGYKAITMPTQQNGRSVVVGYINENVSCELGGLRLYSENGQVYLRQDGTLEMLGDSDFMVRFSELKAGFDQLKSDFNTHTHTAHGTPPTTPSIASVDSCKIDEIKTL